MILQQCIPNNMSVSFNSGINTFAAEQPDFAPKVLWRIGGFPITDTMLTSAVTVLVVIIFAIIIRCVFIPKWRKNYAKVGAIQMFLQWLIGGIDSSSNSLVGEHTKGRYTNFIGFWFFGVVFYIFVGTIMELLGLRPATASLSMTLALGLFTFVFIHSLGLAEAAAEKKLKKRLLHYVNPITWVTDSVVPISMALRLCISVFSGFLIMELLYSIPWPVAYPALGNIMFTLFHAVIQSYIFMTLSLSFISEAVE